MLDIEVKKIKEDDQQYFFDVQITEENNTTEHQVILFKNDYNRLSKQKTPEEFIKKSFEFLLERESKESILKEFNILDINKYFSEYEREIQS